MTTGTEQERWVYSQQWLDHSESPWMIFRCDSLEFTRVIPDGSIDLIITDTPYESLEKHRDSKRRIRDYERKKAAGALTGTRIPRLRDWFPIMPNSKIPEFLSEMYRILSDDSHCYLYCDDETSDLFSEEVKVMQRERGSKNSFKWWKRIVWDKMSRGQGYHYANQHEFVVFLEKGKRKLNSHSYTSVLQCKRVSKGTLGGRDPLPTEKPVSLNEKFILNSSNEGDLIFDPFCGSGSTGIAAAMNNREFLGFDVKSKPVRVARRRLREIGNE